jgi:hypothetical protein
MPIYAYKCKTCGKEGDTFQPVSRYKEMPMCCGVMTSKVLTPLYVMEDVKPFVSPIDNKEISSRKALREHNLKHDVVQTGNEKLTNKKPKEPCKKERINDIFDAASQLGVQL